MSALIFVALAIAWAAYLIPKALRQTTDATETRSVESFSPRLRVLAQREAVSRKRSQLVVNSRREADEEPTAAERRAQRLATQRATQRRRRVLSLIVLSAVVVGGLAGYGTIKPWYAAIPAALLVGWLVLCRVMVKRERQVWAPVAAEPEAEPVAAADLLDDDATESIPRVGADVTPSADPSLWDPVPVTLPTYVNKSAAPRRTVRSIDLESSGVWTSGRTVIASQMAREADEAAQTEKAELAAEAELADEQRAVGS